MEHQGGGAAAATATTTRAAVGTATELTSRMRGGGAAAAHEGGSDDDGEDEEDAPLLRGGGEGEAAGGVEEQAGEGEDGGGPARAVSLSDEELLALLEEVNLPDLVHRVRRVLCAGGLGGWGGAAQDGPPCLWGSAEHSVPSQKQQHHPLNAAPLAPQATPLALVQLHAGWRPGRGAGLVLRAVGGRAAARGGPAAAGGATHASVLGGRGPCTSCWLP